METQWTNKSFLNKEAGTGVVCIKAQVQFVYSFVHYLFIDGLLSAWASLAAQTVKNLPAMQETQGSNLGRSNQGRFLG